MKLNMIKCFEGPEGVYYESFTDLLWLFTNKQFEMKATGIMAVASFYVYDIECVSLKRPKTIIKPSNTLVYIGGFD